MYRHTRSVLLLLLAITIFSACSRMPDHARYIPKEAVAVAGINLKGLGKKIAWNVITGSKLFKEMQKRLPEKNTKDAMNDIEKAGIDAMNTFYVYVKTDTRFRGGNRITALVPLSDAGAWENYIKQVFPKVNIQQHNDRKETNLGDNMYVGWNKDLLIIINVQMTGSSPDSEGSYLVNDPMDMAAMSAEMESAFGVTKENSIVNNKRFSALEMKGHDLTFWLNYDQLMSQYMSGSMGEKMGMSLSNSLWKDAAIAAGFDFIKGKITGDVHYYLSPDMKEIGTELGSTNASKDMIDRLPPQNVGMVAAAHISPKGVKSMLEKMGLLGLMNLGLSAGGLSGDNIMDAFTGDMAFVMSDFALESVQVTDSFMGQAVTHYNQKPSVNMCFVMKINKKEEFQRVIKLAKETGMQELGNGFVVPLSVTDSVYLLMNDQYMVASNKYAYADGFLKGDYKGQKMSEGVVKNIPGYPVAMYMDIQQLFSKVDAGISHSPQDSAMIMESKKLLKDVSVKGGSFKNEAFEYHMEVNFANTDENSIIQLIDYGMRMSEVSNIVSK